MKSKDLMIKNEAYSISDFDMPKDLQKHAKNLCFMFNQTSPSCEDKKKEILKQLFGQCSDLTFISAPFNCDYGFNIHTKGLTVINYNCTILDTSPVYIGKNCFIAPNVVISCVGHSLDKDERASGILTSKPITIGDDVWIGANSTILQGVTIGDNVVIGAGSVVTKDIPSGVVALGSPARAIRPITEKDKLGSKIYKVDNNE